MPWGARGRDLKLLRSLAGELEAFRAWTTPEVVNGTTGVWMTARISPDTEVLVTRIENRLSILHTEGPRQYQPRYVQAGLPLSELLREVVRECASCLNDYYVSRREEADDPNSVAAWAKAEREAIYATGVLD